MITDVFAGTHQFLAPEVVEGCESFDGTKGNKKQSLIKKLIFGHVELHYIT